MLFSNAYYEAENNIYKGESGSEEAIGTLITVNNTLSIIYSDLQHECISYRMNVALREEYHADRKSLLEVCNIYDDFPVHATVESGDDKEPYISFVYKHIVPKGIDISAKEIVNVFRVFEKYCAQHRTMFAELHKSVK